MLRQLFRNRERILAHRQHVARRITQTRERNKLRSQKYKEREDVVDCFEEERMKRFRLLDSAIHLILIKGLYV